MASKGGPAAVPDTALILAAGAGSRLRPRTAAPKPLTDVRGRSLAERIVATLRAAGVARVVVTVGHEAATVAAHFAEIGERLGVAVAVVEVADWDLGNGVSALAARPALGGGPFFLLMSDHLFDPAIAKALAGDPPAHGEIRLAVDGDKAAIFDIEDVTRVVVADGRIAGIGKMIEPWDAGDTGVFLCSAGLFEGLERAAGAGGFGLSDGVRILAAEGRARVVDVTGLPWIDVDTPEALREAERLLAEGRLGGSGDVASAPRTD